MTNIFKWYGLVRSEKADNTDHFVVGRSEDDQTMDVSDLRHLYSFGTPSCLSSLGKSSMLSWKREKWIPNLGKCDLIGSHIYGSGPNSCHIVEGYQSILLKSPAKFNQTKANQSIPNDKSPAKGLPTLRCLAPLLSWQQLLPTSD